MKILVIEDNLDTCELIEDSLKAYLCETRVTHNLKDGLLEKIAFEPDLVLLDCSLPDADSVKVISKIEYLKYDSAVVMLTGNDSEETKTSAIEAGADDYLDKNILTDNHKFLAKLTKAWTLFKNRLVVDHRDERLQSVDQDLAKAEKTVLLTDKPVVKHPSGKTRFEEIILTQTFENGATLAELKGINKQQVIQIDTVDKKVDGVDKKVDGLEIQLSHTNGSVRDLQVDMAVVKKRHESEDQLKKDTLELLTKIFGILKGWVVKVFAFLSLAAAFLVAAWIWHLIFPHTEMPVFKE